MTERVEEIRLDREGIADFLNKQHRGWHDGMGSLSQTRVYGTALLLADAVRAALAQAERERDYLKTRVISVANFDEMQRERDAARAEVERLKGDNQIQGFELSAAHGHQEEAEKRAEQAEADLARVREILTGACARYDHWYVNGASAEAENMAYELVSAIRAALEGR